MEKKKLLVMLILAIYINSFPEIQISSKKMLGEKDSIYQVSEIKDTVLNEEDNLYDEAVRKAFEEEIRVFNSQKPEIGISYEKLMVLESNLKVIDCVKLTWSKLKWDNVSLQISGGFGYSNNLENKSFAGIIDGKINVINLDLAFKRHFYASESRADYYVIFGFNVDLLKWKYNEAFEAYNEDGYYQMENKDGTSGLGLYLGIGVGTVPVLSRLRFGLETSPGIIFIPAKTDNGFENLLKNIFYLRFKIYLNYDARQYY